MGRGRMGPWGKIIPRGFKQRNVMGTWVLNKSIFFGPTKVTWNKTRDKRASEDTLVVIQRESGGSWDGEKQNDRSKRRERPAGLADLRDRGRMEGKGDSGLQMEWLEGACCLQLKQEHRETALLNTFSWQQITSLLKKKKIKSSCDHSGFKRMYISSDTICAWLCRSVMALGS